MTPKTPTNDLMPKRSTDNYMKITTYTLRAKNGSRIRVATKVLFENGYELKLMEKVSSKVARMQAVNFLASEHHRRNEHLKECPNCEYCLGGLFLCPMINQIV